MYKEADSLGIGNWNFDSWAKYWLNHQKPQKVFSEEELAPTINDIIYPVGKRLTPNHCILKIKEKHLFKFRGEIRYIICSKCSKRIAPLNGSRAINSYKNGELAKERCIFLLKSAHFRHKHTQYDPLRKELTILYESTGLTHFKASKKARMQARQIILTDVEYFFGKKFVSKVE